MPTSETKHTRWFLALPFLFLVALRIALALSQPSPLVLDELGYLGNARYLATGEGLVEPAGRAAYKIGYSLLLVPVFLWTSDAAAGYTAALLINALLTAAVYPLVVVLVGYVRPDVPLRDRSLVAAVISVYPALVLFGTTAMSINALWPGYLLLLVLGFQVLRAARLGTGFAFGAVSGFLYLVHERTLGILLIALTLVPGYLLVKRRRFLATGSLYLGAAVLLAAAQLVSVRGTEYQTLHRGTSILKRLHSLSPVVIETAGQAWYAMVATAGLVAMAALAAVVHRRYREKVFRDNAFYWLFALGSGSSVFAISVVFMARAGQSNPTYLLYGRYVEAVLVPFLAFALAVLHPGKRTLQSLGTALAGGGGALLIWPLLALLLTHRAGILSFEPYTFNVPALYAPRAVVGWSPVDVTALAANAALVLGLAFAWRWRLGMALSGLLFVSCSAVTYTDFWHRFSHDRTRQRSLATVISEVASPDVPILYDTAAWPVFHYYYYDYFLHPRKLRRYEAGVGRQPAGELIITPEASLDAVIPGSRLVAIESIPRRYENYRLYLWVLPGSLRERLVARGWVFPGNCATCLAGGARRSGLELVGRRSGVHRIPSGGTATVRLTVTNRGTSPWPVAAALGTEEGSVRVGWRWLAGDSGQQVAEDRADLPYVLLPGQTTVLSCPLHAVDVRGRRLPAGRYRVVIGLVHEGHGWFSDRGDGTLVLEADVS